MICPHCFENFTWWQSIKSWVWVNMPWTIHRWLEQRQEKKDLQELIDVVATGDMKRLNARELRVVESRLAGKSFQEIAKEEVMTMTRIKWIQAKAVRKLGSPL